jgi:hypothetical protein
MMYAHVDVEGHTKLDFDRRLVRKALMKGGREIRKEARRLVARRAISKPGEAPGKQRGYLQRSIDLVTPFSKTGFWVKVEPTTQGIKKSGRIYYPAVLFYGVRGRRAARGEKRDQGKAAKAERFVSGMTLEPRDNYMVKALERKREGVRAELRSALQAALISKE